jgi:hypothetical protein
MSSLKFLADRASGIATSLMVRQTVQRRFLRAFAFTLVTALTMSLTGTASAQSPGGPSGDPNVIGQPEIHDFGVTWVAVNPTLGTYKFTITGTARNTELLLDPAIEIEGYPFESIVAIGIDGGFTVETTLSGSDAFGRSIVAVITDGGEPVSLEVDAST